jgi:hypothetical protein
MIELEDGTKGTYAKGLESQSSSVNMAIPGGTQFLFSDRLIYGGIM